MIELSYGGVSRVISVSITELRSREVATKLVAL